MMDDFKRQQISQAGAYERSMTTEDRINRGFAAKRLMEDEVLAGAFTAVRERYAADWAASLPHDADGRERLFRKLAVIGDVQNDLMSHITDGAMARRQQ